MKPSTCFRMPCQCKTGPPQNKSLHDLFKIHGEIGKRTFNFHYFHLLIQVAYYCQLIPFTLRAHKRQDGTYNGNENTQCKLSRLGTFRKVQWFSKWLEYLLKRFLKITPEISQILNNLVCCRYS